MDITQLTKARALLRLRRRRFTYKGNFTFLCADMAYLALGGSGTLKWVHQDLDFAVGSLWNILTVCDRLEWTSRRCRADQRVTSVWTYYAKADIEYWHIQMRTLLDHLANIISRLANRSRQVPFSFSKLYERVNGLNSEAEEQEFAHKLGSEWLAVMRSANWYPTLRNVREELVHWGGQTMVFLPPSDGILFQVHKGGSFKSAIDAEPLMLDQNVVFFDRYAAFFLSNVLLFLEDFAATAYARLELEPSLNGMMRHFGFGTLMRWIDSTIEAAMQQGGVSAGGKGPTQPRRPAGPRVVTPDPPGGHANLTVEPDD
jgi:hypothetical protein